MQPTWRGIYPAVSTQFHADRSLDVESTQRVIDNLIADGVHGLIMLGTVGENTSLSVDEKRRVLEAARETANGRVPVISGVAEYTTALAAEHARTCESVGLDGVMALPAMVYGADRREVIAHIRGTAAATDLPVMIYNNPAAYGIDIAPDTLIELAQTPNIVAVKESSEDPRRITDLINLDPNAITIMSGVDDVALECMVLGAVGWISGFANVFPRESVAIYDHLRQGELDRAIAIYRWMMPSLHMDTHAKLVQMIKLAEQVAGRGSETVRPPRLELEGDEREYVIRTIEHALANRPAV